VSMHPCGLRRGKRRPLIAKGFRGQSPYGCTNPQLGHKSGSIVSKKT
jgi:hypothetical protein